MFSEIRGTVRNLVLRDVSFNWNINTYGAYGMAVLAGETRDANIINCHITGDISVVVNGVACPHMGIGVFQASGRGSVFDSCSFKGEIMLTYLNTSASTYGIAVYDISYGKYILDCTCEADVAVMNDGKIINDTIKTPTDHITGG